MKNISRFCFLIIALMLGISAMGQAPQKFGFQAVARNAAGRLASNQSVGLRVSILQGIPTGTIVYAETHTVTTNGNGLFSVNIGEGTVFAGNFSTINWANGPYFIKSEIDINGGTNYTLVSTQQMISVPYALHAFKADQLTTPFVETQVLSIGHDTIFLTGGSFVVIPAGFSGSYNDLTNKPTIPTVPTNVSAFINDAGYLTSFSESQILSIGHDTIFLTGGSFVVLPAGFSGSYNDLTNKPIIPTVPTNVGAFTNDAGYITSVAVPTNVSAFTNDAGYITSAAVPTNVSTFTNDAGYLTTYTETQNLSAVVANGNSAGHSQIKNVNDPTDPKDAINKKYLDSLFAIFQQSIDSLSAELAFPGGALTGTFSVSAGSTVRFSRGNLQYQASTNTWRFAPNQYDCIGSANSNISSTYSGWIDLFGLGTSGWNSGANCYQPYSTSTSYSDYYPGGSYTNNLTGSNANADWGVYNPISNGGNQAGRWRTLTQSEWDYLFNTRSASTVNGTTNARYCKATVNGVRGVVVFPDSYTHPSGVAQPTSINTSGASFTTNNYSASQWTSMQTAGAVFLPAAGFRAGSSVYYVGTNGCYWSASYFNSSLAYHVYFSDGNFGTTNNGSRHCGHSVRLVQDLTVSSSVTACDHYLWHGYNYIASGDYSYGSETLHLTINQSTHNSESQSTSGTYSWHGTDYSTTGTYTYDYTNSNGCASTDTLLLSITPSSTPGQLLGDFSVAAGSTVRFSQGNLQYQASTNTWRFAENQFDIIGSANYRISSTYSGWIDLFGWGTSGWNSGATNYQPYSTSISSDYCPGRDYENDLTGIYANADWGVYNPISNGGNQAGRWRTLTIEEWYYLFFTRSASTVNDTANARFCKATVNGVCGIILFPDSYSHPAGVTQPTSINTMDASFSSDNYSASQWSLMQAANAVFLPAAGTRWETSVNNVGTGGGYWSASAETVDGNAHYVPITIGDNMIFLLYLTWSAGRPLGVSVRLVQDHGVSLSITACDYYLWHRYYYTASGDYTDGADTLHLTINQASHNSESRTASSSYTWYGTAYTLAGTYTYDYTNSYGCPSSDTLHLTIIGAPTVSTNSISSITSTTATAGGNVTATGSSSVTARGVCWSTSPNPTISNNYITDGTGTGSFSSSLTGLTAGTTYYVRAYATNSAGTAYGSQVSFTTDLTVNGALPKTYSVSSTKTVKFSQGNLQYQASTGTWRFAENQYDIIGSANSSISSTYSGWIDLFGWGTSGYHNSSDRYNTRYYPYSTECSTVNSTYNNYGYGPSTNQSSPNLTGTSANYDWGVYNPISNGGNLAGRWRTLTIEEWYYLFFTRSASTVNDTANARFCKATVDGVSGIIIFPDSYTHPAGVTLPASINTSGASFSSNTYTASQWVPIQSAGAVFLPAAGQRRATGGYLTAKYVAEVGVYGTYWSASGDDYGQNAYGVLFYDSRLSMYGEFRWYGWSVRLVQDCDE